MPRELPLSTAEAAAYIGITENALKLRRNRGDAPTGHRLSYLVVYWRDDLDAWLATDPLFLGVRHAG